MPNRMTHKIHLWQSSEQVSRTLDLVCEEPLSIRVEGRPYAVVMRMPGDELAHAAGFCLTEGLIESKADLATIACCEGADANQVTVTLTPERRLAAAPLLQREGFVSQTSCGICGKQMLSDLIQETRPMQNPGSLDLARLTAVCLQIRDYQPVRVHTRATHAALILDADFKILSTGEDVGRHNALDKAIGRALLDETLETARFAVLSSRLSFELVQKAARARIATVMAVSRPTDMAVQMARQLNMTLLGLAPKDDVFVYCGGHRISP